MAPDSSETPWRAFLALGVLVFVLLFARSMSRFFDLDEHQFVAPPILLVNDGQVPYVDYPYFHMPTLIGIYAAVVGWSPYKLLAARAVSAMCGTATIAMLFALSWRMLAALPTARRWWLAGGITLVFLCSRFFTYTNGWAWNHDTAVCCTLAAVLVHLRALRIGNAWLGLATGILLGTAVGTRLSFALAVIPFALSMLVARTPLVVRQRVLMLTLGVLGATVACLPAIVLMVRVPDQFFFGNLHYASLSTQFYTAHEPHTVQRFASVVHFARAFGGDPGNATLLAFFLYAVGYRFWRTRAWRSEHANELLLLIGLLPFLLVGVMGPTPMQYQYTYMLLPFMTLAVLAMIAVDALDPVMVRRWMVLVTVCAGVTAVTGLPRWYWGVIHLPTPHHWTPIKVHAIGEWVKANSPPDARVLTIDPVFPLEANMKVYPEYAVGRFVMHVGEYMTLEDRRRFRMAWSEELDRVLADRPPDAIFIETKLLHLAPFFETYANAHGFERRDCPLGNYILWTRLQHVAKVGGK